MVTHPTELKPFDRAVLNPTPEVKKKKKRPVISLPEVTTLQTSLLKIYKRKSLRNAMSSLLLHQLWPRMPSCPAQSPRPFPVFGLSR